MTTYLVATAVPVPPHSRLTKFRYCARPWLRCFCDWLLSSWFHQDAKKNKSVIIDAAPLCCVSRNLNQLIKIRTENQLIKKDWQSFQLLMSGNGSTLAWLGSYSRLWSRDRHKPCWLKCIRNDPKTGFRSPESCSWMFRLLSWTFADFEVFQLASSQRHCILLIYKISVWTLLTFLQRHELIWFKGNTAEH